MVNIYFITISLENNRRFVLAWTAATNARTAWSRFVAEWGQFVSGVTREEQIAELKRVEGARLLKQPVDCDGKG